MAHAMLHPEPKQGQRTDLLRGATSDLGFDKSRLSRARAILRHSEKMALALRKPGRNFRV